MRRLTFFVFAAAAAGFAFGLLNDISPASAQRPPIDAANSIARHGRRYVVPAIAPQGVRSATGTLRITNYGFEPTSVVVVRLASPDALSPIAPGPGLCGRGPDRIAEVRCIGDIAINATAEIDLSGMASGSLIVYSLDANAGPDCGGLSALADGSSTLAEWEAGTWHGALGQRIAVAADLQSGSDRAAIAGIASSGLDAQLRQRDPFSYSPVAAHLNSAVRVSVVNASSDCAQIRSLLGPESMGDACVGPTVDMSELPPFSSGWLTRGTGPAHGLALSGRGEVIASADQLDSSGWKNASAQVLTGGASSGQIAFPLAVGPLADSKTTLWVSNQHPTATAQIDLLMWDGNGSLRIPYSDAEPLCPGSTRAYDINALAGVIPPTTGRGDAAGPPLLSLRVESTGYGIDTAPPIAAQLEIESPAGTAAYSGLTYPSIVGIAGRLTEGDRPIARGFARGITLVPGVMVNVGPERRSTVLAIQVLNQNPMAERQARIDIYDLTGRLVVGDVAVQLGTGPAGFLDLSTIAGRIGDAGRAGFVGSAVVRGGQNQGTLGVVALTRPTAALDRGGAVLEGDQLTLAQGNIVLFELDPSLPSPTPLPTRSGPTATATTPPDEPTPTAPVDTPLVVLLPWVGAGE